MNDHFANSCSLFRPYIKLDLSGANLYPRDTCTFCANEISSIMSTLRAMYGLRRVNLAVVNRLMSSLTIHLLNLPSEQSASNLAQGLQDLQAMSLNHQFAARCIDIISSLATKWNISLPESIISLQLRKKANSQRQIPSPPSSNFWAASIPRKESSDNSSRSETSQRGSPFMPPTNPSPRHNSFSPVYGDARSHADMNPTSSAFWTPFPLQNAPVPSHNVLPSMPMDMTPVDHSSGQWPMFNSPISAATSHPQQDHQQHNLQGMMDGIAFQQGWQWQN